MAVEVNADSFENEVLKSELPVLVDFWGPQCGPCLALMPEVEELADRYASRLKVSKVDASRNRRLCLNLRVLGLPTFLLYNKGKEVGRLAGQTLKIVDIEAAVKGIVE